MNAKFLNITLSQVLFVAISFAAFFANTSLIAQNINMPSHEDSLALENVIIEKYYVSNPNDSVDKSLPIGSITYRIYVDLKPKYKLQLVYGDSKHNLSLKTSTFFYNDTICFAETGFNIDAKQIHKDNVALDSWITMGAATKLYTGIPILDDKEGGLIDNRKILFSKDGLTNGILPNFQIFNLDLNMFRLDVKKSEFTTQNGGWAAMGGVKGPTEDNRILIAQMTTNGEFTYELNIQIGTPSGGSVKYVASNPEGNEIVFKKLTNK